MEVIGNVGFALLLTVIAGLSTGIGSSIAYFIKRPKTIYLSFSLGLSAGVMIYVSFVELLPQALDNIGELLAVTAFFLGIFFISIIDMVIPEKENPHSFSGLSENIDPRNKKDLMRTGLFTALAIGIHNFPEGLATFGTALGDPKLGIVIAIAIAIHNIPEGISVSIPIFYATNSKNKAFLYSFLSGVAEPIGALIGFLILLPFLSSAVLVSLMAFVAGIMVYISIDELLPMAHQYGHSHTVIIGVILGMMLMAFSIIIL
ncbi:MAG: zinc transporter ZupT [Candidatus Methanofastidiosum methylothiophilum]|uniref:Zinc transporter ZupT n=1 Tax=Candidatus Methanofastidiosum methylothiophilum TaxID=1705564 RepID=A0A150IQL9_9EURY|nr:MAG: zinc transporter ZupT [Candidatus Methanofastidiosum methylthiophilus]